ncbi:MAG: hypothetical protein GWP09_02750, partial [Nitrospiraceae bacterium]|nr:hypothetical protein [Nitrospiraceae bacterium]
MKKTMRVVFVILLLISLNIYVVLSPGGISKNSCYSRSLINMGDVTDFTYQRSAAVNYGMYYYNKYYLSDGYNFYDCGAGDCAHFVSCAIGNEQNWRGGGLSLGYRWHDYCKTYYYGVPGSRLPEDDRGWDLVPYLINHHLAKIVSSVDQLSPGDIIQYKWSTTHTHVALYVGNHYIVDHYQGTSPWGYNALYNNDSLYGGSTITFVHIFDNPLLEPDASSYFDVNYLQSGDRVKCLVNGLRVRKGPGVGHSDVYAQDYKIKGSLSAGDLGTVKYGPATLDGKYVWYYIDWDNNLSGWSAQGSGQTARDYIEKISTTPDQPPTARIELRKQGTTTPISTINVNEFFDIYVGGSTDDKGIVRVRFSSDESQDGIPTGSWTNWYDWNSSSGSWNAPAKTEAWLFSTEGIKEVWVEVEDGSNQSDKAYADITATNTSKPDLIVEDIWVDPDPPTAGGSTRIWFKIKNQGTGDAIGTFFLEFYFDGNYMGHVYVSDLPAGSTHESYWQETWPSDTNQHTIRGVVDSDNTISESDESNNERTEYFSATPPTLTVNVTGPSSGYTNTNYTFTASASG